MEAQDMLPTGNLKEQLEQYVTKVKEFHERCRGNEADTKAALIEPLFVVLGYGVADPRECQREHREDFGKTRSKEPVDYAFFKDGRSIFVVEAKEVDKKLSGYTEQLADYFAKMPSAKLGILTNGVQWQFFTDIDSPNIMDKKPFVEWRVLSDESPPLELLTLLQKSKYEPELLQSLAEKWHKQNVLIEKLSRLLEPSPEFIRLAIADIATRNLTEKVVDSWKPVLDAAIKEWVKQQRLSSVLRDVVVTAPPSDTTEPPMDNERGERQTLRRKFWTTLLERAKTKTELHAGVSPNDGGWIATGAGTSGLGYDYVITKHESNVQLYIDLGKDSEERTRAIFDSLKANQQEIERLFGEPLSWEPLEGKRGKRIAKYFELGGYRDGQAKWPEIQDAMIDAMVRLESALQPFIAQLKRGA
jgi:hypothetical protein